MNTATIARTVKTKAVTTVLRMGSRGPAVTDLQHLLLAKGGASTAGLGLSFVDSDFGVKTQAAVRSFQFLRGIRQDGVVGPQTWKELANAAMWPTNVPGIFLRQGDAGADALQKLLIFNNFSIGAVDGVFGPRTHAAVVEWQRQLNFLTNTVGVVGPFTFGSLRDNIG